MMTYLLTIAVLSGKPVLDGSLDDAFWKSAGRVEFSKLATGEAASGRTEAWLARDGERLFVAFRCHEAHPDRIVRRAAQHDGSVTQDDCVEVLIDPGTEGAIYYHLAVNAAGIVADQKMTKGERDRRWSSGVKAAARIGATEWAVEMAIPLAALEPRGGTGKPWRLNLGRAIRTSEKPETVCWVPGVTNFHSVEKFIPVGGMERFEIAPSFLPRLGEVAVGGLSEARGRLSYTVHASVTNLGKKAGEVEIAVTDVPAEGKGQTVRQRVPLAALGSASQGVRVPVAARGPRQATVKLILPETGEVLAEYAPKGSEWLALMALAPGGEPAVPARYGAEVNPTGDPIGGGAGYRGILEKGDYTVASAEDLLVALKQARPGQVVYVASDSKINLTGNIRVQVPDGVTLAGNRGKEGSPGPLLFSDTVRDNSVLLNAGTDARITGLRVRGPEAGYAEIGEYRRSGTFGISVGANGVVDNCEVSHFNHAGVSVAGRNVHVHHCFIHEVHAYPVLVGGKALLPLLIEANLIHYAWHGIAGSGDPGTGYEARYNIMVAQEPPKAWNMAVAAQAFDMHAYRPLEAQRRRVAADRISIHHNTADLRGAVGAYIRGVPRFLGEVYGNWFVSTEPARGVLQVPPAGNLFVYDNAYGPEKQVFPIQPESTPRILFKTPAPPDKDSYKVSGRLALDVEVAAPEGFRLEGVVVRLDEKPIWVGKSAPPPGEVVIDAKELAKGEHEIAVTATDNRNVTGRQSVFIIVE